MAIPKPDQRTAQLEHDLTYFGKIGVAKVKMFFAGLSREQFVERYPQLAPAVLPSIRGQLVSSGYKVAKEYLSHYEVEPKGPPPGTINWLKDAGMWRARFADKPLDLAVAQEQALWEGRALGEPHRVARDTTVRTVSRFERVPEAGACDFCRRLASRGAVYYSSMSAAVNSDLRRYHDRCRCSIRPVRVARRGARKALPWHER